MKIMKKPAMKIMAMKAQVAALTMNLTKAQAAASAVRAMKSMKTHGKAAKMAASNGATTMKRMKSQTAASSVKDHVSILGSCGSAIELLCEGIVSSHFRPEAAAGVLNELMIINRLCRCGQLFGPGNDNDDKRATMLVRSAIRSRALGEESRWHFDD